MNHTLRGRLYVEPAFGTVGRAPGCCVSSGIVPLFSGTIGAAKQHIEGFQERFNDTDSAGRMMHLLHSCPVLEIGFSATERAQGGMGRTSNERLGDRNDVPFLPAGPSYSSRPLNSGANRDCVEAEASRHQRRHLKLDPSRVMCWEDLLMTVRPRHPSEGDGHGTCNSSPPRSRDGACAGLDRAARAR